MLPNQSEKFKQIKNLISEGKFDTALQELAVISNDAQLRTAEQLKFQLLEVEIYNETGKYEQALKLSEDITIEFINITHSTPQVVMVALHTKDGILIYANDFKFDNNPIIGKKPTS